MSERVGFGVVGCGSAALPVCAALRASPAAELRVVYDRDLAQAADLAQRHGVPPAESLEELLEHPGVQAVYVAVPHAALAPTARLALQAGKPVLAEKPLALTLAEADGLIALAEARGLPLGVFYELRHHAAIARARALVRAGAIGRVNAVRVQTLIDKPLTYWQAGYTGRSPNPWRGQRAQAGGGVVLMNTSHLLDAVLYVTGLRVLRVAAEVETLSAPPEVEVEDTAAAVLRFDTGAVGSLIAGAHFPGARQGDECFDLYGATGQLRLPDPYGEGPLRLFLREPWANWPAGEWHTLPCPAVNVHAGALEDFARAVRTGQPAPTSGRDARRVLAIVLALYQSAAEGRAMPVQELAHVQD
jgi:UDP-N-acetyl-2-amino-2-deoxyglucuronate dehydrogenase